MPPTDPGPGIFPATAAACAAAAAWAVAACCCICRWHCRKSNTCTHRTQMSGVHVFYLQAGWKMTVFVLPLCRHWGKFYVQHHPELVRPHGPNNNSEQTQRDHWDSEPKRHPRPYTPAQHLYRYEAYRRERGEDVSPNRKFDFTRGYEICSYLALSIASVRWTLLSWPRQKRSPPEGST